MRYGRDQRLTGIVARDRVPLQGPVSRPTGNLVAPVSRSPILGLLGKGLSPSDVIADYPQLLNDVLACPQYAARAVDQRTLPLRTQ